MWIFSQTSNVIGRPVSLTVMTAQSTLQLSRGREQREGWVGQGHFPIWKLPTRILSQSLQDMSPFKLISSYIQIAWCWGPIVMTTASMQLFNFDITWCQNNYVLSNFGSSMCCWMATLVQTVYSCHNFFLRWHAVLKRVMRTNEKSKSLVWGPFGAGFKMFISFSYMIPFKSFFLYFLN